MTLTAFLSGCSGVTVNTSTGVCKGLKEPVNNLAKALEDQGKNTPPEVIVSGGRVVIGYDKGCT